MSTHPQVTTRTGPFCAAIAIAVGLSASARASVLIVTSDSATFAAGVNDVRNKLAATGRISGVIDVFNAGADTGGVPTLARLSGYNSVLVFGTNDFADRAALGDRLAAYVDLGRTVVEAAFCGGAGSLSPFGRWQSGGYAPFGGNLTDSPGSKALGTRYVPDSPLLVGVVSFRGGVGSYYNAVTVPAGVTRVADWTSGVPLAVQRSNKAGAILGLNFYPPSASVRGDYWDTATDGARLMANALNVQHAPEPGVCVLMTVALAPLVGRSRWIRRRRVRTLLDV